MNMKSINFSVGIAFMAMVIVLGTILITKDLSTGLGIATAWRNKNIEVGKLQELEMAKLNAERADKKTLRLGIASVKQWSIRNKQEQKLRILEALKNNTARRYAKDLKGDVQVAEDANRAQEAYNKQLAITEELNVK